MLSVHAIIQQLIVRPNLAIVMPITLIVIFALSHLMYRYIDSGTVKLLGTWSSRLFDPELSKPIKEKGHIQQSS
ncbi:hypothetical protein [Paenibacillus sp. SN-8-1]|uniref:hypothetical protein n=1 Tax=Paenibacillus sp. SN-8-1 TaxID=3435409 RepID=UPI003D9A47D2